MEMDHPRFLPIPHQAKEKKVVKKSAVFLCAALFAAFLTLSAAPPDKSWLTDFKKAEAEAKAKKLPMFVVFTQSEGNQAGKTFDEKVLASEKLKSFVKGKFVLVYLDCTQKSEAGKSNQAVAAQREVTTFPSVLVTDASGKTLTKLNESSEEQILSRLKTVYSSMKKASGNAAKKVEKKKTEKKSAEQVTD